MEGSFKEFNGSWIKKKSNELSSSWIDNRIQVDVRSKHSFIMSSMSTEISYAIAKGSTESRLNAKRGESNLILTVELNRLFVQREMEGELAGAAVEYRRDGPLTLSKELREVSDANKKKEQTMRRTEEDQNERYEQDRRINEEILGHLKKTVSMSTELFSLTYGALVTEMLKDFEDPKQVNLQLDKMGFNMGNRLADDFLAKNVHVPRCADCRQLADALSKNAIPSYLGVPATVTNWGAGDREFSLILENNPLTELVEVPSSLSALNYSQIIAGAIRGALEALHFKVYANVVENPTKTNTEIRIKFDSILKDNLPAGEDY